jgi:phospholipid/cholesterol/gamma-HCH transport system substrate-binding protein
VKGNLIRLAVLLVVTAVLAVVLTSLAANVKLRDSTSYQAIFENVSGLTAGQEVRIAGVDVGRVRRVQISSPRTVLVSFDVESSLPVMAGSNAIVRYKDLIGDRYLEIADGPGPLERLAPGGLIPQNQTHPAVDLDELFNGFRPLFEGITPDQVNMLSSELIGVFQGQSGTMDSLIRDIGSLTTTLADRDEVIGQVIDNLDSVLGTVAQRDGQLSNLIVQVQELASGLADNRREIGTSINSIGELTAVTSDVLREARPSLKGTVAQLGRTAEVLDRKRANLDEALRLLPPAYQTLGRLGAYANTFNFYICALTLRVTGPDGRPIETPELVSQAERCQFRK